MRKAGVENLILTGHIDGKRGQNEAGINKYVMGCSLLIYAQNFYKSTLCLNFDEGIYLLKLHKQPQFYTEASSTAIETYNNPATVDVYPVVVAGRDNCLFCGCSHYVRHQLL